MNVTTLHKFRMLCYFRVFWFMIGMLTGVMLLLALPWIALGIVLLLLLAPMVAFTVMLVMGILLVVVGLIGLIKTI